MGTRRITYVIVLVAAVVFYALYPYWFSWYLMILMVLMAPFDFFFSIPGMHTKRVALSAPRFLEQGASGALVITTYQRQSFPSGRIKVRLTVACDDVVTSRRLFCDPDAGSRYEIAIDTLHSGLNFFNIKRIHIASVIGLFSAPVTVNLKASVLILPAPVKPPNIVSLPRGVILRPKPGGGFAEDSDLRHYRKGDPVRSIHWKLSAKYDSVIIQEPLVPPPHSRLVYIAKWNGASERDLTLGRLRWISAYLLKWDLAYYVRLGDDGPVAEITCEKEHMDYLFRMLCGEEHSIARDNRKPAMGERFSWVFRIDGKGETEG